jgi:hypothetical protein
MFNSIKTFIATHETAVTATLSVAFAVAVGVAVVKVDMIKNPEDYNTEN